MIELELLGIVFAILKCKIFLLGLPHFDVLTDHRPLIPILNRQQLDEVSNPRLRRLKMKIMTFNYEAAWTKGSDNLISDNLSRNPRERVSEVDLDRYEHGETEVASTANCIVRADMVVSIPDAHSAEAEDQVFVLASRLWDKSVQVCDLPLRLFD